MTIQIRATFCGQDGSLGFENGKQYRLEVSHIHGQNTIVNCRDVNAHTQMAEYESALAFLLNWTCIQGLDQKLDIKQFNEGHKHGFEQIEGFMDAYCYWTGGLLLKEDIKQFIKENS